jgi:hypothetical protein
MKKQIWTIISIAIMVFGIAVVVNNNTQKTDIELTNVMIGYGLTFIGFSILLSQTLLKEAKKVVAA